MSRKREETKIIVRDKEKKNSRRNILIKMRKKNTWRAKDVKGDENAVKEKRKKDS